MTPAFAWVGLKWGGCIYAVVIGLMMPATGLFVKLWWISCLGGKVEVFSHFYTRE